MAKAYDPDRDLNYGPYEFLIPMFSNVVGMLNSNPSIPQVYTERAQNEYDLLVEARDKALENDMMAEANYDLEEKVNALVRSYSQDTKSIPKYALYTEYFLLQRIPCNKAHPYADLDADDQLQETVRHAIRSAYNKNRSLEVSMRHRFLI